MAAAALPLMIAGQVVGGIGGLASGLSNSSALRRQARGELQAGVDEETRIREAARASMGEQIAAQFSNGMMGGTGSALDALRESAINAKLDALEIRRDAMGRAKALRARAKQEKIGGYFALAEGLIGAAGSFAGAKADWADARRGQSGGRPPQGSGGGVSPSGGYSIATPVGRTSAGTGGL